MVLNMIIHFEESDFHYDKFIRAAKGLARQYDAILKYVTIGESHDNRDIILLRLGLGQKYIICSGGVHGRETVNPIVLLKIIEYYADLYMNFRQQKLDFKRKLSSSKVDINDEYEQMLYGACIYELLQTYTILFVPLLNPDGYMIAQKGFHILRDVSLRQVCENSGIDWAEWKANGRGVDINRNFPSQFWKQKFEGDHPASEKETKALMRLFLEYPSIGYLDFHSRGREIYYYRNKMSESYNKKQLDIAARLCEITGYVLVLPEEEIEIGDSGGNTVHYYSEYFYKPAITIETVEDEAEFPLNERYRFSTYEEIKHVISEFGSLLF